MACFGHTPTMQDECLLVVCDLLRAATDTLDMGFRCFQTEALSSLLEAKEQGKST